MNTEVTNVQRQVKDLRVNLISDVSCLRWWNYREKRRSFHAIFPVLLLLKRSQSSLSAGLTGAGAGAGAGGPAGLDIDLDVFAAEAERALGLEVTALTLS